MTGWIWVVVAASAFLVFLIYMVWQFEHTGTISPHTGELLLPRVSARISSPGLADAPVLRFEIGRSRGLGDLI